jgi:hypothetical protein
MCIASLDLFDLAWSLLICALTIWSVWWVYRDAEARGKSGCLMAVVVCAAAWPLSLLVWFAARPSLATAGPIHCRSCGAVIPVGRSYCPSCGRTHDDSAAIAPRG